MQSHLNQHFKRCGRLTQLSSNGNVWPALFFIRSAKLNSDSFSHKVKGWILINAVANKEEKAIKSMMKLPEITGLYTTNGKWDLAAEITSTSLEGFDRAISALRSINGVLETETSLLLSSRIGE